MINKTKTLWSLFHVYYIWCICVVVFILGSIGPWYIVCVSFISWHIAQSMCRLWGGIWVFPCWIPSEGSKQQQLKLLVYLERQRYFLMNIFVGFSLEFEFFYRKLSQTINLILIFVRFFCITYCATMNTTHLRVLSRLENGILHSSESIERFNMLLDSDNDWKF